MKCTPGLTCCGTVVGAHFCMFVSSHFCSATEVNTSYIRVRVHVHVHTTRTQAQTQTNIDTYTLARTRLQFYILVYAQASIYSHHTFLHTSTRTHAIHRPGYLAHGSCENDVQYGVALPPDTGDKCIVFIAYS